MNKLFLLLLSTLFMANPQILLAEGLEECTSFFCEALANFPEINAWLIATFTMIGLILRAVADFLTFAGKKLNNEKTGQFGNTLESYSRIAAQIIGWFGGGTPRVVLEKKVEKALDEQGKK